MSDQSIFLDVELDGEIFTAMMNSIDDIGVVLRAHYLVERAALKKVSRLLPAFEDVFPSDRSDLALAINMLRLLEVPDHIWNPAHRLKKIRNDVAHGKVHEITSQHVRELLALMDPRIGQIVGRGGWRETRGGQEVPYAKGTEPPRMLFVVTIMLYMQEFHTLQGKFETEDSLHSKSRNSGWLTVDWSKML